MTSKNNFSFIRMYTCTGVAEEVEKWGRKRELGLEMTRRREGAWFGNDQEERGNS